VQTLPFHWLLAQARLPAKEDQKNKVPLLFSIHSIDYSGYAARFLLSSD
jgi:glycogen synthase